jgi:hypothetical protein
MADGWLMDSRWMVAGWSMGGRWVVDGWSMGGRWMVDEWSMGGRWVVGGWSNVRTAEADMWCQVTAGSGLSPEAVGLGEAGTRQARWSRWRVGVRDGMWDSMCEAMPWLVKCSAGMGTAGVCA